MLNTCSQPISLCVYCTSQCVPPAAYAVPVPAALACPVDECSTSVHQCTCMRLNLLVDPQIFLQDLHSVCLCVYGRLSPINTEVMFF